MDIRRMCGPGVTAAFGLGAGLFCSSVVAQSQAPAAGSP